MSTVVITADILICVAFKADKSALGFIRWVYGSHFGYHKIQNGEGMMNDEQTLMPIQQKEIIFYGDELTAIKAPDGHIYVSVRHICDALGLNVQAQTRRINRQEVLQDGFMVAKMATIKGERPATWLRVDLLPLWLTGISISMVKEEAQLKLKHFQKEAAKVLWEAFQEGRLTEDISLDSLLDTNLPAAQAYKIAMAVMQMARQQLLLEVQVASHHNKLLQHDQRLEQIEAILGDSESFITTEQAMQISQAVKAIAMEIQKKTKRNEYGAVYGQMYREFGITSYKQLPMQKFESAMKWLTEWYQKITDSSGMLPF